MNRLEDIHLKRAVVAVSLPCRRCGHDLRGVRLDHECPECGFAVKQTFEDVIDPESGDLPQLANPKAVASGVVGVTTALAAAGILIVAPYVIESLIQLASPGFRALAPWMRASMLLVAAGFCVIGIIAAQLLRPAKDTDGAASVRRNILMLVTGLTIVIIVASAQAAAELGWLFREDALPLPELLYEAWLRFGYAAGAVIAFFGLGRILAEIGKRSRAYREARGGRQGIQAMNVAVLFIVIGSVLPLLMIVRETPWLRVSAQIIVASSTLMLVIGLLYLVINALWIGAGLRKPPWRLRDLVRIEPDTTWLAAGDQVPGNPDQTLPGESL